MMQQQTWRKRYLGFLAGFAVLSLSAASLQAQDTTSAGQARLDTSAVDTTKLDSTLLDSTKMDTTKQDTTQNPPGYRGMEEDTATGTSNDSTWRDSAGLNRDKEQSQGDTPSDTSKLGP